MWSEIMSSLIFTHKGDHRGEIDQQGYEERCLLITMFGTTVGAWGKVGRYSQPHEGQKIMQFLQKLD